MLKKFGQCMIDYENVDVIYPVERINGQWFFSVATKSGNRVYSDGYAYPDDCVENYKIFLDDYEWMMSNGKKSNSSNNAVPTTKDEKNERKKGKGP